MLPAPKIVKAESNRTDLHAKIAEPPPIFYKDSEKNTPCQKEASSFYVQKESVGGVFRIRGGGRGRLRLFSTPLFFREKPVIGRIGRSGRKKRVFFGPSRCVFLSGFFLFLYIFLVLVCKVFRTNPFFVFTGEAFPDLSCILLAQL